MAAIDYVILVCYLVALAGMGLWLARRAGQSSEHYFLGGRSMPWWALGASGMASNLDIAGTMAIVALIYRYGLHGFFVEFRGGVVLPIAVFLSFMGKWHRRSAVMTTAEWMLLRFGDGAHGQAARMTAAATYLVITIAMVTFFFTAGGQFLTAFLPFTALQCTVGMAVVAFGYTLVGGFYGVVWTDVFQAGIIGIAAVYISVVAAQQVTPELIADWPGAAFNTFMPHLTGDPGLAPYASFGGFLAVWALKGVVEGLGGSGGSAYMAQRYYAARSDAECQKIGMLWTAFFAFRWPMVLGFAVLAMKLDLDGASAVDGEQVLPLVLKSEYFPAGVRGVVIAALLAAAMSTFDSTINAGASYVVNDIFRPLRRTSSQRELVWVGYSASFLIVALGLGIALLAAASVLEVWVAIVMLLFPAFLVPFALRWYWGCFNGAGFTAGVLAGFAAALFVFAGGWSGLNEAGQFLAISGISFLAAVAFTYLTAPVSETVLLRFYSQVGPFGVWPAAWRRPHRREHARDLQRLGVSLLWQVLTFLLPMGAVLHLWSAMLPTGLLWAVLTYWLLRDLRRTTPPGRGATAESSNIGNRPIGAR